MLWFTILILLRISPSGSQQFINGGQLVLEDGQTLRINTSEPSALVIGMQGHKDNFNITIETNHWFQSHVAGRATEWKYGIANITFRGDVLLRANSSVHICGENALSITSLQGDIVIETNVNLSCPEIVWGGKCIGGYMPKGKSKKLYHALIIGNGPGGINEPYLSYWSFQCIGGSGHGGKGGFPESLYAEAFSGQEYGLRNVSLPLGGSSGSYSYNQSQSVTSPGHGGGAIQLVAKRGLLKIEGKVIADAQQTYGNNEIYSGSSGGLIRLLAKRVHISNKGSLHVNGAHAGKTYDSSSWSYGVAGGAGGIVHILANEGFISTDSIFLLPGNSTGCEDKPARQASPGFLLIKDITGDKGMFQNNTSVFPQTSANFSWSFLESTATSNFQNSTTDQTAASHKLTSPQRSTTNQTIDASGATIMQTSSADRDVFPASLETTPLRTTEFKSPGLTEVPSIATQCTTDFLQYKSITPIRTATLVTASADIHQEKSESEWDEILNNATAFKLAVTIARNTSLLYCESLIKRLKMLVSRETLNENTLTTLESIFTLLRDIIYSATNEDYAQVRRIVSLLLKTADASLESKNDQAWRKTKQAPLLLNILENVTLRMANEPLTNNPFKLEYYSQRMVVQVATFKGNIKAGFKNLKLPDVSRISLLSWKDTSDFISIPLDVLLNYEDQATVSIILCKDLDKIIPPIILEHDEQQHGIFQLNSLVLSARVLLNILRPISSPVRLQFKFQENAGSKTICAFWDISNSSWSTAGMAAIDTNQTHANCVSDHLTSFAILTQHTDVQISNGDGLVLSLITYMSCGLSIVCLFITLLVYLAFETLSTERHKIHMSLSLSLLMAQSLFLSGINAVKFETLCRVIAVGLHYLFSATFMWMCIEGFHLYILIVTVFRTHSVRMKYYYMTGWVSLGRGYFWWMESTADPSSVCSPTITGFPLVMVGVAASVHPKGYGTSKACWLSTDDQFIWAFLAPVIAVILINFVVLAVVVKVVIDSASATLTRTDYAQVKAGLKSIIVLLPLLGVSWVFGLFTVSKSVIVFQYLFAFANGLQGVFIFLAHCVGSSDVQSAFKRLKQKHLLSRGSNNAFILAASKRADSAISAAPIETPNSPETKKKQRFAFISSSKCKDLKFKEIQVDADAKQKIPKRSRSSKPCNKHQSE